MIDHFVLSDGTIEKYDYNGLVNKPESDETLSVEGGFADAKKVGERFDTIGQSISPIYLGDFMMSNNEQHGCSMRIGDKIYSFVSSTTETTNTGRGLVFDLDANSKIMEKSILVGHANSCAYDSENDIIYVVPTWDYENNKAAVYYIYKYDTDLNYIGVEETNFVAVGISYDPITKTLYAKSGGATGVNKTLYKKNENEWVAVSAIPTTKHEDNIYNITYNQDLAVYDSKIYLSSSHRSVAVGVIKESEVEIFSGFACSEIDSMAMFKLGELEGMEFDENGHLIAADYIQTSTNSKNAYVIEIPTGITLPQIPNITGSVWEEVMGLSLSSSTQSKFALNRKEIRSFAQIRSRVFVPPLITITGGSGLDDPYFVRVFEDIAVVLSGIYNVGRFDIYAGTLEFYITTSGATVNTPSSYSFALSRLGKLKFGGSQPLTVSSGNLSNVISNNGSYTIIDVAPVVENGSFRISSSVITETGVYRNATKILAY